MSEKPRQNDVSQRPEWWRMIQEQIAIAEKAAPSAHKWIDLGGGLSLSVPRGKIAERAHDTLDEPEGY